MPVSSRKRPRRLKSTSNASFAVIRLLATFLAMRNIISLLTIFALTGCPEAEEAKEKDGDAKAEETKTDAKEADKAAEAKPEAKADEKKADEKAPDEKAPEAPKAETKK
jgi:hypothetical protein